MKYNMLNNQMLVALSCIVTLSVLLSGCGKPTTPESLNPYGTGGYEVIETIATEGYAQDVLLDGDLLYIAQGEGGLMIVDVANAENPQILSSSSENIRGYCAKIAKKDSAVYLAAGTFGVTVANVSDPYNPDVTFSNLPMKPARNLKVLGNYLFTSISEQGIAIADISYPTQPDGRSTIDATGYSRDCAITPDSTFLLAATGEVGFSLIDISVFENGFGTYPEIASIDLPGYADFITIDHERQLAFLACGTAGLQIVDYADTTNVRHVGSYDGSGYAKEVVLHDNKAFVAAENGGLQVVDVTTPSSPELIGIIDADYLLGITCNDEYIFVADEEAGVLIIKIP